MRNVLLVGRAPVVVEEAERVVADDAVRLFAATDLAQVQAAFAANSIDHVVMGAGLAIEVRLEVVREVFRLSDTTTVHMKDFASGPDGYLPFVKAVLSGVASYSV